MFADHIPSKNAVIYKYIKNRLSEEYSQISNENVSKRTGNREKVLYNNIVASRRMRSDFCVKHVMREKCCVNGT